MPRDASVREVKTSDILPKIKLYLPDMMDLFCMKLFPMRDKDFYDAKQLLTIKKDYFFKNRALLKQILEDYVHSTEKYKGRYLHNIVHAVSYYNYFVKTLKWLVPLDDAINNDYLANN